MDEHGPFIDDVPIKTSICEGCSIAMFSNQRVTVDINVHVMYVYNYVYNCVYIYIYIYHTLQSFLSYKPTESYLGVPGVWFSVSQYSPLYPKCNYIPIEIIFNYVFFGNGSGDHCRPPQNMEITRIKPSFG